MYARIPDRFLRSEEPEAAQEDDGTQEGAQAEAAPGRNPSKALTAWTRARTLSSAMLSLKLLSSMHAPNPLALLSGPVPGRSPLTGSSPSLTPPGKVRSVLHPDNQKALARQGFYGDDLPEGVDPSDVVRKGQDDAEDEEESGRKSADDRRKMFHKTRSKRHRSLVEEGLEGEEDQSRDSLMKSVDFSTTTESTDSGELSAPTTPGDVFLDRVPSPLLPDRLTNIEDLYLPDRGSPSPSFNRSRQQLTDSLMTDMDNDDNYLATPRHSRQPTVEKAATLTEDNKGEDGDDVEGVDGGRTEVEDPVTKSVTIVVSGEAKQQRLPSSPLRGLASRGASGAGGGMNFLSIVSAAVDRLSDSGSEHTLVDHQSSSSGSPRPLAGSESPRLFSAHDTPKPVDSESRVSSSDSAVPPPQAQNSSGGREPRAKTRAVESGPVLYVYHKRSSDPRAARDENDNLPHVTAKHADHLHAHRGSHQNLDEDLPRMSSIQSDSSGFGDTEVSGDAAAHEMASLKVSNLGSSCESSATMASTCTVLGNSSHNHSSNSFHCPTESIATQTPSHLQQSSTDVPPRRSQSTDELRSHSTGAQEGSGRRYVTMCYIPNLNNQGAPDAPVRSVPVKTLLSTSLAGGRSAPRGRPQISIVLREKDKGRGRKNETPLSEELAMASLRMTPHSSSTSSIPRTSLGQVPRLALQGPTVDTSSVEGSRGSVDELERDDRPLNYSSWSRQLPSSSSRGSRRRHYPGTDGEEGGSGTSVEGSSVYSCASTSDSIASGGGGSSDLLDYHKLLKLINQPTVFKGRRTHVVHYRPRRHLRDWPGLQKRKKLQEETRLAQYAMQKFKTELSILETSVMAKYQMFYEDMTQDEREDVEELQHLWSEVRRQVMETDQLLTSRMKSVATGNDRFNTLSSISVLQRMIDLLKEQTFQKQLGGSDEMDEEEEEEDIWEETRRVPYRRRGFSTRFSAGSWAELPRSPRLKGRYSSSTSHLPLSPAFSDSSYDQFRSALMSEVREEMRTNIETLKQDLHQRDSEIHRLQLQLMLEGRSKKPRSTQQWSRSLPGSASRRRAVHETDV